MENKRFRGSQVMYDRNVWPRHDHLHGPLGGTRFVVQSAWHPRRKSPDGSALPLTLENFIGGVEGPAVRTV